MTVDAAGAPTPEPAAAGDSPGQMLRQQREQRGFSLQDVADELHLDRWVIETLEADRFTVLGAPVYARGHLRKYAQLLELSPEAVLTSYESLSESLRVAPADPVPTTMTPQDDRRFSMWIAVAALAVCVGALAIWRIAEPPQEQRASTATQGPDVAPSAALPETRVDFAAAPVAAQPEPAVEQVSDAGNTRDVTAGVLTENAAPAIQRERTAPAVRPDAPPVPATAATVELELVFVEPSWVEVYDSAGDKLMFDIGQPDRPRTLSGSAPLDVLLGKADAVQVAVNGEQVSVPLRSGRDAVRFTVGADGALR